MNTTAKVISLFVLIRDHFFWLACANLFFLRCWPEEWRVFILQGFIGYMVWAFLSELLFPSLLDMLESVSFVKWIFDRIPGWWFPRNHWRCVRWKDQAWGEYKQKIGSSINELLSKLDSK